MPILLPWLQLLTAAQRVRSSLFEWITARLDSIIEFKARPRSHPHLSGTAGHNHTSGHTPGWWARSRLPLAYCRVLRDIEPCSLRNISRAKQLALRVLNERLVVWRSMNATSNSSSIPVFFCSETRAALVAAAACARDECGGASPFHWREVVSSLAPDFCRSFPDILDLSLSMKWGVGDESLRMKSGVKRTRSNSPRAPCASSVFHIDPHWRPSEDISRMSLRQLEHEHIHLLIRDMKCGKVVLFTGAGLFCAAGLPNWKDLLLLMIENYNASCTDAMKNSAEDVSRAQQMVTRLRRLMNDGLKHHEQVAQVPTRCPPSLFRMFG